MESSWRDYNLRPNYFESSLRMALSGLVLCQSVLSRSSLVLLAVQTGNSVGGSRSHNMPDFVVDEMSVLFPDKEGKH